MDKNNRNKVTGSHLTPIFVSSVLPDEILIWWMPVHMPGLCTLSTQVKTKKKFGDRYFCRLLNRNAWVRGMDQWRRCISNSGQCRWNKWCSVEGSSWTGECHTLKWESLDSNHFCSCFESWTFLFVRSSMPQFTQLHKWVQLAAVEMWVNSLCAVIGAWLNASQRSRVGARMNRSISNAYF